MFNADVAIPGTVRVSPDAVRTNASSAAIKALDRRLEQLTGGDRDRTVVTVAWNIESARSQLLAALIASLGYKQVYFYAEGLEAWIAHDLPVEKRES